MKFYALLVSLSLLGVPFVACSLKKVFLMND